MNAVEERWDVVIFNVESRKVAEIIGTNLLSVTNPNCGFHSVEKRMDATIGQMNDAFDVKKVPTGTVKIGDVLPT